MKFSIFCPFGLKMPIHTPQNWGFGGILPPKWEAMSTKHPKGTSLRASAHTRSRTTRLFSLQINLLISSGGLVMFPAVFSAAFIYLPTH